MHISTEDMYFRPDRPFEKKASWKLTFLFSQLTSSFYDVLPLSSPVESKMLKAEKNVHNFDFLEMLIILKRTQYKSNLNWGLTMKTDKGKEEGS
jgi:hypothetical protein